jgi:nucleotide-binding universal stress UspA family protein
MVDPAPPREDSANVLEHARAYLESRGMRARYVPAEGEPADMIESVAEEHDADLIVVGTREASIVERLPHPSVSRAVARRSDRDVLIVHPD